MLRWQVRRGRGPRRADLIVRRAITAVAGDRPAAPRLEGGPPALLLVVLSAVAIGSGLWLAGAQSSADIVWAPLSGPPWFHWASLLRATCPIAKPGWT
jgi:hypothetical protein